MILKFYNLLGLIYRAHQFIYFSPGLKPTIFNFNFELIALAKSTTLNEGISGIKISPPLSFD